MLNQQTLLISGGTGSFGNAVLKRFLNTDIKEIRILSRDELKQNDMRKKYNDKKLKFYLADVRDKSSLTHIFKDVDYVFHAAALKQVPSCEFNPMEAVKTNVIGTDNILNTAIEMEVKKIVVLSTDKAVYPINAMGISKAMMEKVAIAKSRTCNDNKTIIVCTRYGNVLGTRGSVIPMLIEQIKKNQKLTITDPNMTRFLMSLEEAVQLVLYAFENGSNGEIYVQKSPASTIKDLAQAILELYNKVNYSINYIGTRHGEKKHEVLLTSQELNYAKDLGNYYLIPPDNRDLNYDKYLTTGIDKFNDEDSYNSNNTYQLNVNEIKEILSKSVLKSLNI